MADQSFVTPVLRMVQGDCFDGSDKNMQGVPYKDKAGNPCKKWMIAGAGKKGDPAVEAFKASIEAAARQGFPQLFTGPGGACTHPAFSYKVVDGDGVDANGKPNKDKPGFAGHWVFKFGSNFAPKCFQTGKWRPEEQLSKVGGVNPIPRGHFIQVAGTMSPNGDTMKPGMYVNLNYVNWVAVGDVIQSGPDAATLFGGANAAAPMAAASAPAAGPIYTMTPAAGAFTREQYLAAGHTNESLVAQGFMTITHPVAAAPAPMAMAPAPMAMAPAPMAMAPAPMTMAPAPAPVAAGPVYTMLPAAGAFTREQYIAAGHTDDSLVAQGFMTITHPVAAAPAPAPMAVAPHPGILAPQAAPAPLAPAGSAPPPPAPAPTACAAGFRMANPSGPPYAAYIAQGWNDAALVQNGHMVPA